MDKIIDPPDFEQFSRQMNVPFIGQIGQEKLQEAHIVIIGCGGLGCPALLYLAAAGIGHITLIDNDTISLSNLHRQILFSQHDIGAYKAEIAAKKIHYLYPNITIKPTINRLDSHIAKKYCIQADLIIDGTDSFLTKHILSNIAPQLLTASVTQMQGYIAGFNRQIPYQSFFPTIPKSAQNCNDHGILGPIAGLIGNFLAIEAIKIILNHPNHILHQLVKIDFDTLHFQKINFSNICETPPNHKNFPLIEFISLNKIQNETLIDIREADELEKIPLTNQAISMPLSTCQIEDFLKIDNFVLKCQSGRRAEQLALKIALMIQQQNIDNKSIKILSK